MCSPDDDSSSYRGGSPRGATLPLPRRQAKSVCHVSSFHSLMMVAGQHAAELRLTTVCLLAARVHRPANSDSLHGDDERLSGACDNKWLKDSVLQWHNDPTRAL